MIDMITSIRITTILNEEDETPAEEAEVKGGGGSF